MGDVREREEKTVNSSSNKTETTKADQGAIWTHLNKSFPSGLNVLKKDKYGSNRK